MRRSLFVASFFALTCVLVGARCAREPLEPEESIASPDAGSSVFDAGDPDAGEDAGSSQEPSDAGASDAGVPLDDDAGFVGPSGSVCETIAARATTTELAKSPRASADAEWLAIELRGGLLANDADYARIDAELNAIVAAHAEVSDIHVIPNWVPDVEMKVDAGMLSKIPDAGPFPWDCLNAYYRGETKYLLRSISFAIVEFEPRLNTNLLLNDYALIPGVELTSSGGWTDGSDICLVEENGGHVYLFDRGGGDCPAGCTEHAYYGFVVAPDGGIQQLGAWDSNDAGTPVPEWVIGRPACTKNL